MSLAPPFVIGRQCTQKHSSAEILGLISRVNDKLKMVPDRPINAGC